MRNLKKILAMVLALVMSLSLMATAGAAQFPDVDDSNPYKTAIDVLDELKVFQGFEDGTFKPTDTLNRAQAAVLVYRIATGDVENKYLDNYTYMQQSKFNDLDGYNWAKGYINYCQNAQIVVGTSATTFDPGAPVTGYQLMVMLLRTLGYGKAGEFTDPKGWELQTSTIAEREGLLKNVVSGDFGAPAQRQMVAEILFRGLLHETVEYSPLTPNGYTNSGVTLGSRVGLEEITGVVTANQIADLGGSKPLAEGRTNLDVEGKTYKLNLATTAEEIGTSIHAYIKGSDVLAREDAGTDIKDNEGAKSKVKDLADGLRLNDETEYYVNYDPVLKDTSDWRLEYVVVLPDPMTEKEAAELVKANGGAAFVEKATADDGVTPNIALKLDANEKASLIDSTNVDTKLLSSNTTTNYYTYDKVIPVEKIITGTDHTYIKNIFYYSDSFNVDSEQGDDVWTGEVYVATKSGVSVSVDKSFDISDELSYKEFYEKYIDDDENRDFDACDRGEWLRVIDNDGDGDAEYVLLVEFVMTTITDYDKRTDTYTVEYDVDGNHVTNSIETTIKASDISKMSEDTDLSDGAVILYTLIDGVYHVCNPQVDTASIEKKTTDIKTETFTADGKEYTWSGIDEEAAEYYNELVDLDEEVNYNLYLDHFGFVRLATEASKGLVLLTDGYYNTNYRDSEWKATIWNGTELVDVDVEDCDTDRLTPVGFIDETEGGGVSNDHGNRGTWKRLREFGQFYYDGELNTVTSGVTTYTHEHYVDPNVADVDVDDLTKPAPAADSTYADPFMTNIAGYVEEDGVYKLYDVTDISTINGLKRQLNAYEIVGTEKGYKTATVDNETVKAKNRTLWGIDHNTSTTTGWINGNEVNDAVIEQVQTTGDTVYYFVSTNDKGEVVVTSWKGYENVPEELGNFTVTRGYMVSHSITGANYEIADVVVFEGAKEIKSDDAWLIISAINTKRERALGKGDEGGYGETSTNFNVFDNGQTLAYDPDDYDGLQDGQIVFYADEDTPVTENFQKYGIYAGKVVVAPGTRNNNYCEFEVETNQRYHYSFYTDEINAYELNQNTKTDAYHASRNLAVRDAGRIDLGDELIVMCDKDMNVLMAVNVSKSGQDGERDGSIAKLNDLHDDIVVDQADQKLWKIETVTFLNAVDGTEIDTETTDIKLKVKTISKDAASFAPELDGTDAAGYQITKIEVTPADAATVLYTEDGVATLKDIKKDITEMKVTLASEGITFENVKVKGVDVVDGKVTVSNAVAADTGATVGADLVFDTTADTVTVTGATLATFTGGTWTSTKRDLTSGGTASSVKYSIILEKDGYDPVVKTINVTIANKNNDATIQSISIKGVEVTNIPAATGAAVTITEPFVINSSDAINTTDKIIDVVMNDPNAKWEVKVADTTNVPEITTAIKSDAPAGTGKLSKAGTSTSIVITGKAEDGTTVIDYTLGSVTVNLLTLKGAASYTNTKYDGNGLTTTGVAVGDDADIVITVAADTPATQEITKVEYQVGTGNKKNATDDVVDGKLTIPASELTGKSGDIIVTVTEEAFSLSAKKTASNTTIGAVITVSDNPITIGTTDTDIPKTQDLVFTVAASDNAHYVAKVEYQIGATGTKTEIKAVGGKYTIEKAELTDNVEIFVTEADAAVITGTSSDTVLVDIGDGNGFVAIDDSTSAYVIPGSVIKVRVAAGNKPLFDDADNYEISDDYENASSGTDWVWTVTVKDDITLSRLIVM